VQKSKDKSTLLGNYAQELLFCTKTFYFAEHVPNKLRRLVILAMIGISLYGQIIFLTVRTLPVAPLFFFFDGLR